MGPGKTARLTSDRGGAAAETEKVRTVALRSWRLRDERVSGNRERSAPQMLGGAGRMLRAGRGKVDPAGASDEELASKEGGDAERERVRCAAALLCTCL